MKMFYYDWKDGTYSFVYAENRKMALETLDEIGGCIIENIKIMPKPKWGYMFTFKLKGDVPPDYDWYLQMLGGQESEDFMLFMDKYITKYSKMTEKEQSEFLKSQGKLCK